MLIVEPIAENEKARSTVNGSVCALTMPVEWPLIPIQILIRSRCDEQPSQGKISGIANRFSILEVPVEAAVGFTQDNPRLVHQAASSATWQRAELPTQVHPAFTFIQQSDGVSGEHGVYTKTQPGVFNRNLDEAIIIGSDDRYAITSKQMPKKS
ncbi:hypothetical protein TSO5_18340 [Azospirillum sp. TSO5]|nr:hypothetical protein TSO5_18340 [Azospirillum sp. TSO5]